MYEYNAICTRVIDGDTIDVLIDLGLGVMTQQRLRLYDVDTPELRSSIEDERKDAQNARLFVVDMLFDGVEPRPLKLHTIKDRKGKYGRYLATVYLAEPHVGEESCLNAALKAAGFDGCKYAPEGC